MSKQLDDDDNDSEERAESDALNPHSKESQRNKTKLRGNKNRTDNKKKIVLIGSITLGCLICALDIITIVYMCKESRGFRGDSLFCINCGHLALHPDDDLSSFDVNQANTCCVKDGGNISSIVDKLVNRNLKERLIAESRPYEPLHCNREVPVIKMVGKLTNKPDPPSSRFSWLKWDVSLRREGSGTGRLSHDDTFITVGSTGVYLLYSQIVLHNKQNEEPSPYSTGMNRYYLHAIYRASGSRHDEILLGGSYTYYKTTEGDSMITSYVGSPYQLRKGDKMGVKVHDVSQVVPSSLTNFFGIHLIQ